MVNCSHKSLEMLIVGVFVCQFLACGKSMGIKKNILQMFTVLLDCFFYCIA